MKTSPPTANGEHVADVFALEDPDYPCRQLITHIGNKRALLEPIGKAVEVVKKRLNKTKLLPYSIFNRKLGTSPAPQMLTPSKFDLLR